MAGADDRDDLDVLFRRERGRLVARLTRRLGAARLDLAEDVAQDALLQAVQSWPYQGRPDNAAAWLHRVALNKAYDRLRREKVGARHAEAEQAAAAPDNVHTAHIQDDDLRLIFLCCDERLSEFERVALTLKVASGFTAKETAALFLMSPDALGQRLARAKRKLRDDPAPLGEEPTRFEIARRSSAAVKAIYLMFSLGYAPARGAQAVRRDAAFEALRLACAFADGALTGEAEARALAALLCFQSSRFNARETADGEIVLLADQDRAQWDAGLIARGLAYLQAASAGATLTRLHLEAGIASLHATATDSAASDWTRILGMYATLERMTGSPVVTLNAAAALSLSGAPQAALDKLETLNAQARLQAYAPYHVTRADALRRLGRDGEAAECLRAALACGATDPAHRLFEAQLAAYM